MTVEKGKDWGSAGALPASGVVVRSDAEARTVVESARRANEPVPPLGLLGGDLCRTLGGTGDAARLQSPDALQARVDLGAIIVDGRLHWFVAHAVFRKSWWRGRLVAAMNAEYLGPWDVAPRAHPGDGLIDVVDVDPALSIGDRIKARGRLPSGTHVPHPRIATERTAAVQFEFAPALDLWLDGTRIGPARKVSLRVEPDALLCVV